MAQGTGVVAIVLALSLAGPASAQRAPDPQLRSLSPAPEALAFAPAIGEHPNRFGVLLGLVGLPQPLGVEGFAHFHDLIGVGLGFGILPAALGGVVLSAAGIGGGTLDANDIDAEVRVFPFRGSFYFGGAVGRMALSAAGKSRGYDVAVDVTSIYVAPRIGWLGISDPGFSLGVDLGLQVPVAADVSVVSSSPSRTTLESLARSLAALPMPTLSFRVGWML